MAETVLFTYQDLVNRLLDTFGELNREDRHLRLARRAVQHAHTNLAKAHEWSYYQRRNQLTTVASSTTGTIEYDHTGGAKGERVVLLTGSTFPTNAQLYRIIISNTQYKIASYVDTTTVQLSVDSNPGADVASGTSYTLYRSEYPTPLNFLDTDVLIDLSRGSALYPLRPDEALGAMAGNYTPQEETGFCIRNAGEYYGGLSFELVPPPSSARTYDYEYQAMPRPLRTEKYATGTVSVSSTTVTGLSTVFSSDHVGSIIRFPLNSANTTNPTPLEGSIEGDNPYAAQRTIMTVSSTTSLTIDSSVSETVSGSTYVISDPIDVESHVMLSAFERLAEAEFARLNSREDWDARRVQYERALLEAKIADNRHRDMINGGEADRRFYTLRDWALDEAYGGSALT